MQVHFGPGVEENLRHLAQTKSQAQTPAAGSLICAKLQSDYLVLHAFAHIAPQRQHQLTSFPIHTGPLAGLCLEWVVVTQMRSTSCIKVHVICRWSLSTPSCRHRSMRIMGKQ